MYSGPTTRPVLLSSSRGSI